MKTRLIHRVFSAVFWALFASIIYFISLKFFFGMTLGGLYKTFEILSSTVIFGPLLGFVLAPFFTHEIMTGAVGGLLLGLLGFPLTLSSTGWVFGAKMFFQGEITLKEAFMMGVENGFNLTFYALAFTGWGVIPLCAMLGMGLSILMSRVAATGTDSLPESP